MDLGSLPGRKRKLEDNLYNHSKKTDFREQKAVNHHRMKPEFRATLKSLCMTVIINYLEDLDDCEVLELPVTVIRDLGEKISLLKKSKIRMTFLELFLALEDDNKDNR